MGGKQGRLEFREEYIREVRNGRVDLGVWSYWLPTHVFYRKTNLAKGISGALSRNATIFRGSNYHLTTPPLAPSRYQCWRRYGTSFQKFRFLHFRYYLASTRWKSMSKRFVTNAMHMSWNWVFRIGSASEVRIARCNLFAKLERTRDSDCTYSVPVFMAGGSLVRTYRSRRMCVLRHFHKRSSNILMTPGVDEESIWNVSYLISPYRKCHDPAQVSSRFSLILVPQFTITYPQIKTQGRRLRQPMRSSQLVAEYSLL